MSLAIPKTGPPIPKLIGRGQTFGSWSSILPNRTKANDEQLPSEEDPLHQVKERSSSSPVFLYNQRITFYFPSLILTTCVGLSSLEWIHFGMTCIEFELDWSLFKSNLTPVTNAHADSPQKRGLHWLGINHGICCKIHKKCTQHNISKYLTLQLYIRRWGRWNTGFALPIKLQNFYNKEKYP